MTDRIHLQGRAQCSPQALWHALVDNRAAWWPDMDFSPHPGSPLQERWMEDGVEHTASGTVLAVAPGHLFSFRWTAPDWEAHTVVSFELTPADDDGGEGSATDVAVTESGFAALKSGPALSEAHREGWAFHLANLIEQAEK
ncbi:SRPBCC domain-containing protein [Arthrobacter sp. zg-Y20]|uniref:SRPBCC family protein n=1 Tax=unclassified Arthrobacter TaxID=235627 RepID=UPI001D13776E|nr:MULTISPECIES: SRPBCC domain-containing protein [unclassified Arthrobacter]MCC3277012.1 SRPBCC domain-containing protein [Arthrobacter sp. zg-Y20]MDK1317173.1 SRPBCC domain-containing protein [Arthrobacter sp. zg.Y20]WIB07271.1 SRPBCC domain-containing protein [Arthrobacter sp. zg-Y20]